MGARIATTVGAALLFALSSMEGRASPAQTCAKYDQHDASSVGFVILSVSGALMPASEAAGSLDAGTKISSFIACVPIDLSRHPKIGAVNFKVQIYSEQATEAAYASVEYDGPHQYTAQVRQLRTVARSYPRTSIDAYQKYHGCNDPNHPDYIKYDDYGLRTHFHATVGNRRTDATPQQRMKFVFTRDVPPTCGFGGAIGNFISLFGVQPAYGAGFASRLDGTMKYRRSVVRRYDFTNAKQEITYISYRVPSISAGQCLRVEASDVFDQNSAGSVVIAHVCVAQR